VIDGFTSWVDWENIFQILDQGFILLFAFLNLFHLSEAREKHQFDVGNEEVNQRTEVFVL